MQPRTVAKPTAQVEREEQPVRHRRFLHTLKRRAGLHSHGLVLHIDGNHAGHTLQRQHQVTRRGVRGMHQVRTAANGDDWLPRRVTQAQHCRHFLGCAWATPRRTLAGAPVESSLSPVPAQPHQSGHRQRQAWQSVVRSQCPYKVRRSGLCAAIKHEFAQCLTLHCQRQYNGLGHWLEIEVLRDLANPPEPQFATEVCPYHDNELHNPLISHFLNRLERQPQKLLEPSSRVVES